MAQSALRIETKILPGNRLEITLPANNTFGSIGETIEVIVLLPENARTERRSVLDILKKVRSHRPPRSASELDRDLRMERDAWDS
jgi:hypothetical protein